MKSSTRNLLVILIILLLITIILLLLRCCRCCKTQPPPKTYHHGIVFWQDPRHSKPEFKGWVDSIIFVIRGLGAVSDSAYCPTCDTSLIAYSGVGTEIYLSQTGSGGTGTSNPGHPHGDDAPGYFSANIAISNPYTPSPRDSLLPRESIEILPQPRSSRPVIVGVFDTGDSLFAADNSYFDKLPRTCLPDLNSLFGWNFVKHDKDTRDDHANQHGTKVSQFIINQASQYQTANGRRPTNPVEILPVKVFTNDGAASLFDLLCAISYAAQGGVRIINASFGFYEYADTPVNRHAAGLMEKYLEYYLPTYNMLMVAAAGNQMTDEDVLFHQYTGNPMANPRDLDLNPFYPACLAKTSSILANNILVVTTIGPGSSPNSWNVSPLQNFSKRVVDVGIVCDAIVDSAGAKYYCFRDPLPNPPGPPDVFVHTVTGSSFATPIVTGKIAAYYQLLGNLPINKQNILNIMETIPPFSTPPTTLLIRTSGTIGNFIRDGVIGVKKE